MIRASKTFSFIQAVSAVAILAILIWSTGVPQLRSAELSSIDEVQEPAAHTNGEDSFLAFKVRGVESGQPVNTADHTRSASTDQLVPLMAQDGHGQDTAAQDLSVSSNLANGFVVTVTTDRQLTASNGADIDSFIDGSNLSTPSPWTSPGSTPGQENNYGHWGITSDDATLTGSLRDPFNANSGGNRFVSLSTSPVEVLRHNGPVAGTGQGEGTARVGYKVEVSPLQENADDYTATLTYEAVPVF